MNNEETIIEATVEKIIKTKCPKCKQLITTKVCKKEFEQKIFYVGCNCNNYYLVKISEKE